MRRGALLLLFSFATGTAQTNSAWKEAAVDGGLREAFDRVVYSLKDSGHGTFRGTNSAQGLSLEFNEKEVRLTYSGANLVSELIGYGYGEHLRKPVGAWLAGTDRRVEYRRGELTEWYENRPAGLEQGFTLAHRPGMNDGNSPLIVSMHVSGEQFCLSRRVALSCVTPDSRPWTLAAARSLRGWRSRIENSG